MGIFRKSCSALVAAAILGFSGAAKAQTATAGAEPAPVDVTQQMFSILVEEFALAQMRNSPEVKAQKSDEAALKVFRDVFVNEARVHAENTEKLRAQGEQIARTGFKTRDECAAALQVYDGFVLRENVLRNYDGQVMGRRYPGPELRSPPERVQAATTLKGYLRATEVACRRVPAPAAGN